jgi:hypothetical protein
MITCSHCKREYTNLDNLPLRRYETNQEVRVCICGWELYQDLSFDRKANLSKKEITDLEALSILKSGMPDLNDLQQKAVNKAIYYFNYFHIGEKHEHKSR